MKYCDDDTLRKFINAWGTEAQIDMAIEECAELTVALQHFKRCRNKADEVFTEIADVIFIVEEMALMFAQHTSKGDIRRTAESILQEEIDFKMKRTIGRLENE